jgi:hypothetical protein
MAQRVGVWAFQILAALTCLLASWVSRYHLSGNVLWKKRLWMRSTKITLLTFSVALSALGS